ncbi:hypothetical protein HYALB_00007293 [Hymenoscyphus albidus]|uniref:AA1-like domain-containing protein n=1 Tax=Hymenoscyphus albidus TaxID=595503 RepID=A0A9N9QCJ6_9HELO|nr:hypothetical protein HYALB_00007293 [Hymenoscyphus albidus]
MQFSIIASLLAATTLVSSVPTPPESPIKSDNKTFQIYVFNKTSPNGYLSGPNPQPLDYATPVTVKLDEIYTSANAFSGDLLIDACSNYNVPFDLVRCKALTGASVDQYGAGTYFNATTYGPFAGTKDYVKSIFCTKVQGKWDNRVDQFNGDKRVPELRKSQVLCSKGPVEEFLKIDLFQ